MLAPRMPFPSKHISQEPRVFRLPGWIEQAIAPVVREYLSATKSFPVDFVHPSGEPALSEPDSVSWRIFKNPFTLFIGGIAAVILELAEPRVCAGVWEHTRFREDPLKRLRNTGLAAMITVYAPASQAREMIERVSARHRRVAGTTTQGLAYRADDPELLSWVYATASFGFIEAHHAYVEAISDVDFDRYYAEGIAAARLYGADAVPRSCAELQTLFAATAPSLAQSGPISEFLQIMQTHPLLPGALHRLQPLLVRAAIDIVPQALRVKIGLGAAHRLRAWECRLLRHAGRFADRLVLADTPAVQACQRMGLPDDYLYRQRARLE